MFLSHDAYTEILAVEKAAGRANLAADLEREYYPLMSELEELFRMNGFQTRYKQMNRFVWLVIAEKIMEAE